MLPQEESLNVLTEFLLEHGYQKVKNVPMTYEGHESITLKVF